MAKGFEDSLLYVYNRLVSLNEVGGTPDSAGVPISAFHEFGLQRARRWPYTLNATSTHDSKRAEDVRARIDVLSEIPSEWEKHLVRWRRLNEKRKRIANGTHVPTPNEEILLYQTMIGAWPLRRDEVPNFRRRLQDYIIKATRDAMVHTKWTVPNVSHEKALVDFVEAITDESGNNEFLKDFLRFQRDVAYWGALASRVCPSFIRDQNCGTCVWWIPTIVVPSILASACGWRKNSEKNDSALFSVSAICWNIGRMAESSCTSS